MDKTTFFISRAQAERLAKSLNEGDARLISTYGGKKAALISINSPEHGGLLIDPNDPNVANSKLAIMVTDKWSTPEVDSPHWAETLKFEFHDIDPTHCSPEWTAHWTVFSDEMADQIIDMLERTKDAVDTYIIHCEAGISRSAGVCKFVSIFFNLPFPESYQIYNKFVFSTLLRRWRQRIYGVKESWE